MVEVKISYRLTRWTINDKFIKGVQVPFPYSAFTNASIITSLIDSAH